MAIIVSDTFTRADSASSLGTADFGGTYTQIGNGGNNFGIASNQAKFTAPGDNACGYINCGTPNVRITCTFTTSATNSNAGLCARVTDVGNYMSLQFVAIGGTNGLYLSRHVLTVDNFILGTPVLVGSIGLSTTYAVVWTINGTNHTVTVDGVVRISGSDSNNTQDTVTNHGIWINSSNDTAEARWDNLLIEDISSLVSYRFAGPWEAPWSQ